MLIPCLKLSTTLLPIAQFRSSGHGIQGFLTWCLNTCPVFLFTTPYFLETSHYAVVFKMLGSLKLPFHAVLPARGIPVILLSDPPPPCPLSKLFLHFSSFLSILSSHSLSHNFSGVLFQFSNQRQCEVVEINPLKSGGPGLYVLTVPPSCEDEE